MRGRIRRFYDLHKNGIKIAGLCAVIVCSIGVLIAVFYHQHLRKLELQQQIQSDSQENVTQQNAKNGIKGSEVKKQLESLKEKDQYAIVIATQELLCKRSTAETAYLVYPLDAKKQPRYVEAADGTFYMLFGVNYGCVLEDDILLNTGAGTDSYYTIAGFMEENEYAKRNNYEEGTSKTVITRKKYHPYKQDESISIPDDEVFQKGYIYDRDEKEIGCIYYSIL